MNKVISIIDYKGKEILYFNYSGLNSRKPEDFIKAAHEAAEFMISKGPGQLTITDVTNAFGNSEIAKEFKQISAKTKPYRKKAAVIGVTGAKAILLKAINAFSKSSLKAFDNIEEAKEWLVNED